VAMDNHCGNCDNCDCHLGQKRDRRLVKDWLNNIANHIIRKDLKNKQRPLNDRRKHNDELG